MKEYKDLTSDPLQDSITAGPISEDNMLEWEALIQGPEDTPYVSLTRIRKLGLMKQRKEESLLQSSFSYVSSCASAHARMRKQQLTIKSLAITL